MTIFSTPTPAWLSLFPVKRKIFISYHHGGDQSYYDQFTTVFHHDYEVVTDNSLLRAFDSDDPSYVMRRIRESHISGTSCTIVLVGARTWGRKYVDWEISATLDKNHGLIGIRLPSAPVNFNGTISVPDRLYHNIQSGFAEWVNWEYVTQHPANLLSLIERANGKSACLINNSASRRLRNA